LPVQGTQSAPRRPTRPLMLASYTECAR